MTLTLPPDAEAPAAEVEALFPEAKRLERRRRLRFVTAVLAVALVSATMVALGLSGGGSASNPAPIVAPKPSRLRHPSQ
jgi:hypothetical protein